MAIVGIRTEEELQKLLDLYIAELPMNERTRVRIVNKLENRGIFKVSDVLKLQRDDILDIPNFGEKMLEDLYGSLEVYGFYRDGHEPE